MKGRKSGCDVIREVWKEEIKIYRKTKQKKFPVVHVI
jgi:hypothetical protein